MSDWEARSFMLFVRTRAVVLVTLRKTNYIIEDVLN